MGSKNKGAQKIEANFVCYNFQTYNCPLKTTVFKIFQKFKRKVRKIYVFFEFPDSWKSAPPPLIPQFSA